MNKLYIVLFIAVLVLFVGGGAWYMRSNKTVLPTEVITTNSEVSPTIKTDETVVKSSDLGMVQNVSEISLSISSPTDGVTVTSPKIKVIGKTLPKAEVYVNETEGIADANGNFSLTVNLDDGDNSIVVTVVDPDGKVAEREMTVVYNSGQ
jgi:hypothetical protein